MADKFTIEGTKEAVAEWVKLNGQFEKSKQHLLNQIELSQKLATEYKEVGGLKSFEKFSSSARKSLKKIEEGTEQVNTAYREQQKIEKALITQIEKKKLITEGTNKALVKEKVAVQDLNKELKLEAQINKSVIGSLERLKKINIQLRIERDKVNITTKEGQKELLRLNTIIDKNTKSIKENTDGQTAQILNVGNYSEAVERLFPLFGRLQSSLGQISQDTGNLGKSGLPSIKALKAGIAGLTKSALAFIATPIGATIAGLTAISLVTKEFFDYNRAISKTLKLTQDLTGLQGASLNNFRAEVSAVADTFDKEFNEVLISANALSKNFGISQVEALDQIQDGLIRGADTNGQYLDQLREYPVVFKNIGFSAKEFNKLIIEQQKQGIFNDKLIDAIKEADLALKEFTKTQQDALENAFGKEFSDDLSNKIKSGAITSKEAILSIGDEADKLGLNYQQLQQLTADVFKGAGEDAGGFLNVIESIRTALKEDQKELTQLQKITLDLAGANRDLALAKDQALNTESARVFEKQILVLVSIFKTRFYQGITRVREGLTSLNKGFQKLLKPIREMIGESKFLTAFFKDFKRIATEAFAPFGILDDVKKVLVVIGALFSGIGETITEFKKSLIDIGTAFKGIEIDTANPLKSIKSILGAVGSIKGEAADLGTAFARGYSNSIAESKKFTEDIITENKERTAAEIAEQKRASDLKKEQQLIANKDYLALQLFRLGLEKEAQEEILNDEKNTVNERIQSAFMLERVRLKILKTSTDDQLKGLEEGSAKQLLVLEKAAAAKIKISKDTQKTLEKINVSVSELKAIESDKTDIVVDNIEQQLKAKIDSKLKEIEDEKNKEAKIKEIRNKAFQDLAETLGVSGESVQSLFDLIDGNLESGAEKFEAFGSIVSGVFGAITQASNANIQERIDASERERASILENDSLTNEQREFLEDKFDKKKAKLQRKQAENSKKLNLLNATVGVATGVINALAVGPPQGFVLAALVAALGAVQIAAIASQKIPEFAVGTKNAPEGVARVGERGAELITDKKGNAKSIATTDSYTYLNKGDKVYTASETKDILAFDGMAQSMALNGLYPKLESTNINVSSSGLTKDEMMDVMSSTLSKQPKHYTTIDKQGLRHYYKKGSTTTILRGQI